MRLAPVVRFALTMMVRAANHDLQTEEMAELCAYLAHPEDISLTNAAKWEATVLAWARVHNPRIVAIIQNTSVVKPGMAGLDILRAYPGPAREEETV